MSKNIAIVYCAIQPYTVRGGRHEATDKCCNRTHTYNMCCTCVHIYYVCMCTCVHYIYCSILYVSCNDRIPRSRLRRLMRLHVRHASHNTWYSNSLLKESSRQNGYTYILDAPPISVHIHIFMRFIHEVRRVIPHKLLHKLTNTTYTALQIYETNRH